jgi:hypothetical protein
MCANVDKAIQAIASNLSEYKKLDSTERHIYLHWVITRTMTLLGSERPVLVGGGAVEFYTGVRFATGDLDIVAPNVETCESALEKIGFQRVVGDKYYISRTLGALVDVHGSRLVSSERTIEVIYKKTPLSVVSPEDCIVERLASYRRHTSSLDLLNAFLISYHNRDRLDVLHLQERIGSLDLWEYYRTVQNISRELTLHESGVDEAAGELIQFMKRGPKPCAF